MRFVMLLFIINDPVKSINVEHFEAEDRKIQENIRKYILSF